MKIIIPMAGMGKRMRPHTLTTPKPLLKIAGKTIVEWLVEELYNNVSENIEDINYVIGNFDNEDKKLLWKIAEKYKSRANFYVQEEALGTGHAVYCAKEKLEGKVIIAFADTIFNYEEKPDLDEEAIIFTKHVKNPEQYGVVKYDENGYINEIVEKPEKFISNNAIIGIYYFRNGEILRKSIKRLIENDKRKSGEFQLTCSLEELMKEKLKFKNLEIKEWLDCGNKEEFLKTNKRLFEIGKINDNNIRKIKSKNSVIIEPCYIEDNVEIENCIIGPYATIEANSKLKDVIARESIIYENTELENIVLYNSIIGKSNIIKRKKNIMSTGNFTKIENE